MKCYLQMTLLIPQQKQNVLDSQPKFHNSDLNVSQLKHTRTKPALVIFISPIPTE